MVEIFDRTTFVPPPSRRDESGQATATTHGGSLARSDQRVLQ